MIQINNATGYIRNIGRGGKHQQQLLPKSAQQQSLFSFSSVSNLSTYFPASMNQPFVPSIHSPHPLKKDKSSDVTWEFQRDGNWELFEPQLIKLIEGMYSRGTMSINIHFGEWAKIPCTVSITDQKMKENQSEKTYSIRRNPPINTKKHSLQSSSQDHNYTKSKKHKIEHKIIETPPQTVNREIEKVCQNLTEWVKYDPKPQDQCPICFEDYLPSSDVVLLKCNHHFCKNCIIGCYTQGFILCPMCKTCYGTRVGSMPDGKLKIDHLAVGKCPLSGYESYGTFRLRMSFPDGTQGEDHPNPGQSFEGTSRTAYLPDTPEGKEVLNLIKTAWDRKLLFRIGTSVTTGADNQVTWNGVHMKTQTHGGATNFGYPDDTYFQRVKKELADKGIY
jgi:deltex-like protein